MKKVSYEAVPMRWEPDWETVDTVLLDMDGTLLDKHFDDFFWEHYVPEIYAENNDLTPLEARKELLAVTRALKVPWHGPTLITGPRNSVLISRP